MKIKARYTVTFMLIIVAFCYLVDAFAFIENKTYDAFLESVGNPLKNKIVIVGIDDISYSKIGRWPFGRDIQSKIISNIAKDKPAVIGLDISYDSVTTPENDKMLVESIKGANVVCAEELVKAKVINGYKQGNDTIVTAIKEIRDVSQTGYINPDPDEFDGVIRKTYLTKKFNDEVHNSFSFQIYKKYLEALNLTDKVDVKKYEKLNNELFIDFSGKPKSYTYKSAYEVLNSTPQGFFEDKIVLFGPYSNGMQDEYSTSIDNMEKMFGVEIHANIIQNLIENNFKKKSSVYIDLIIILLFFTAGYFYSKRFSPTIASALSIASIIIYFITAKFIYTKGLILPLATPTIVIILVYMTMLVYRYFEQLMERRRITGIFGKYVAPQVVKKILEEGEESLKLGGTRKFISVLFVDIRGFTPLSEKAQPEEVVEILNDYLDLCAKSIFNNGGTLDKFIGDATMAIYNAPLDLEEHAFKAVKTAWEMKQGAEPLKARILERFGKEVNFGIGVNTGYAVVGNIGSKDRMDYTAIGDTVNTSARLESNAKAGQILISQATYDLVKDKVEVTSLGGIKVKGKVEELQVYQVEGLK